MKWLKFIFLIVNFLVILSCTNEIDPENSIEVAKDMENSRIKLSFSDKEIIVLMLDNPSAKDFLELLPLEVNFEDYSRTEKISYLPRKLNTEKAPNGITPQIGDFTYFEPWGNLAIFYDTFSYSSNLILLGHIEEGLENLKLIENDELVKIDRIND